MKKDFTRCIDLNERALSLTQAAAELMHADRLITYTDIDSSDADKKLNAYEVLRTHDTCSGILFTLHEMLQTLYDEIQEAAAQAEAEQ